MTAKQSEILWTGESAKEATNGRCDSDFFATGVSIDTRTIVPGDLFIALEGPNFDGHSFVIDALERGAAAALVHRTPIGASGGVPLLMVDDTMKALKDLGKAARTRAKAKVIAVTGSVGKTGVKEALKFILKPQGTVSATLGNLNNHWGLPLSLARTPENTVYGIFEMGMNHPGEIAPLCKMAQPHVAVITTVEQAHSAFFNGVEEIADAKAEIFTGMAPAGVAVLNRDTPHFQRLADAAVAQGVKDIRGFGAHQDSTARLVQFVLEADGSRVTADVDGERLNYRIGVAGHHWVINSLAALAAVSAVGANVAKAAASLDAMAAPAGRGRVCKVNIPGGTFTVIDESYNANPSSMNAAFEVLGRMGTGPGARRIAVLGDMLELGAQSSDLHAGLAVPLQSNGVDLAFTAGRNMSSLADALPRSMRGGHAADARALTPLVTAAVRPGDVVMVKGSAGSRAGIILEALLGLESGADGRGHKRTVNGE